MAMTGAYTPGERPARWSGSVRRAAWTARRGYNLYCQLETPDPARAMPGLARENGTAMPASGPPLRRWRDGYSRPLGIVGTSWVSV